MYLPISLQKRWAILPLGPNFAEGWEPRKDSPLQGFRMGWARIFFLRRDSSWGPGGQRKPLSGYIYSQRALLLGFNRSNRVNSFKAKRLCSEARFWGSSYSSLGDTK